MKKYEYKQESTDIIQLDEYIEYLNGMGKEGWGLVYASVPTDSVIYLFKRELIEKEPAHKERIIPHVPAKDRMTLSEGVELDYGDGHSSLDKWVKNPIDDRLNELQKWAKENGHTPATGIYDIIFVDELLKKILELKHK